MKTLNQLCAAALVGLFLLVACSLQAKEVKAYQVTGPVLELTPTKIVVQKGDDKWELIRTPETKVPANLKVGDKVTIHYTMTADDVEIKGAKNK